MDCCIKKLFSDAAKTQKQNLTNKECITNKDEENAKDTKTGDWHCPFSICKNRVFFVNLEEHLTSKHFLTMRELKEFTPLNLLFSNEDNESLDRKGRMKKFCPLRSCKNLEKFARFDRHLMCKHHLFSQDFIYRALINVIPQHLPIVETSSPTFGSPDMRITKECPICKEDAKVYKRHFKKHGLSKACIFQLINVCPLCPTKLSYKRLDIHLKCTHKINCKVAQFFTEKLLRGESSKCIVGQTFTENEKNVVMVSNPMKRRKYKNKALWGRCPLKKCKDTPPIPRLDIHLRKYHGLDRSQSLYKKIVHKWKCQKLAILNSKKNSDENQHNKETESEELKDLVEEHKRREKRTKNKMQRSKNGEIAIDAIEDSDLRITRTCPLCKLGNLKLFKSHLEKHGLSKDVIHRMIHTCPICSFVPTRLDSHFITKHHINRQDPLYKRYIASRRPRTKKPLNNNYQKFASSKNDNIAIEKGKTEENRSSFKRASVLKETSSEFNLKTLQSTSTNMRVTRVCPICQAKNVVFVVNHLRKHHKLPLEEVRRIVDTCPLCPDELPSNLSYHLQCQHGINKSHPIYVRCFGRVLRNDNIPARFSSFAI